MASQVGIHAIFIREKTHKAASRSPGIYLKGGKKTTITSTNPTLLLKPGRLRSSRVLPVVDFVATFPREAKTSPEAMSLHR